MLERVWRKGNLPSLLVGMQIGTATTVEDPYAMLCHFSRVRLCAPHRRQSTRIPCPWDSPGKNTGVGCHFLLQCMKVKSESEVAQSCPTLSDPMDCGLRGSSVNGIFQARVLEWGANRTSISQFSSVQSLSRVRLFATP